MRWIYGVLFFGNNPPRSVDELHIDVGGIWDVSAKRFLDAS